MASSDEEVDYMSDTFLANVCGKEDIRPGLIKSHAQQYIHKREINQLKSQEKNRENNPSLKEKELVNREDALSKPLECDNVGFKMLQKLGFKPGSGLGRSGEGRLEPIAVEVKADRQGFGRKSSLEEIARLRAKYKAEAREKLLNVNDYRLRKAEEAAEKKASVELMKCQRVCWELDSKECIEQPEESWFWPENKLPKFYDEEEEEEECESHPTSTNEEENECKVATTTDERNECEVPSTNNEEDECEDGEEEEEYADEDEFSVQEKLEMLTLYLRRAYLYCVWCGHSFDDEKDLQMDCPGPMREDH